MTNKLFLFLLLPCFLLACKSPVNKKEPSFRVASSGSISVTKKVSDLEPLLFHADSIQVLYYDDPDGDSLRYTRYFTLAEINDTTQIKPLIREMDQVYIQEPKARPCRSEGKLYLLRGDDILKTVYFSTRGDRCTYFYFIKDGSFFYFPLTQKAATWLKTNRQKAKKPISNKSAD